MVTFFHDIFSYQNHFNQLLIGEFEKHHETLPERTIPLFCHMLNAHQIWNARILGLTTVGVRDVHALEVCQEMDRDNLRNTFNILEGRTLTNRIAYKTSKGDVYENSILEILFHVSNHHTHHRAQIVSDFRSVGIDPIVTDYIFYKR